MAKILILGAGVSGLAAGLLLARDGHEVEILERDADPVPDASGDAWERWSRDGVTQFRQAHYLQPRGRAMLAQELPDVLDAIHEAGACAFDPLGVMPPAIEDRVPRPDDDRFETVNARRPVLEQAVARIAEAEPSLTVRRGTRACGLLTTRYDGVPHVTGVRTDDDTRLDGDLVVDAMGRRSPLPAWLAAAGAGPIVEEAEDSGFVYYTRFFRGSGAGTPPCRGPINAAVGSMNILTLPADSDTWSVTLYCSAGDRPLKRMRHAACFDAVVAACPLHAHWLDGDPLTDVMPMGGVLDRRRRLVVDGAPAVTGIAHLADAWVCTNPSMGRGVTLGLLHARLLRDVARSALEEPLAFAEAWDEATERELGPWYRDTLRQDRAAARRMSSLRDGQSSAATDDPGSALQAALPIAMAHDADVFRMFLENRCCWTTLEDGLARPGMVDRILEVAREHEPSPMMGPGRERLLSLLEQAGP